MLNIVKLGIVCTLILVGSTARLRAQETKGVTAAPIPAQISTAKTVFISNTGVDINSLEAMKRAGDRNQAYDEFYRAVKDWGRYRLVGAPAEADLVFEIRFITPMIPNGNGVNYEPQILLTILDTKTHFPLWALVEPVQGAFRKATWEKNLKDGVTNLVNDVKELSGAHPSTANGSGR